MRISDWSSDVCSSDLDLRDLHIALRAGGCDGERPSAKHDIFSIEKGDGRVASAHHQIGKLADVTLTPGMIEGERASIFVEMAHGARRCDGSFGGVGAIHGGAPLRKRAHRLSDRKSTRLNSSH